jgi:hypothetical protein
MEYSALREDTKVPVRHPIVCEARGLSVVLIKNSNFDMPVGPGFTGCLRTAFRQFPAQF